MPAAGLDPPDRPLRITAIFAQCFTGSKDVPAARNVAGRRAAQGDELHGRSTSGAHRRMVIRSSRSDRPDARSRSP